jgi:hypothetical protein
MTLLFLPRPCAATLAIDNASTGIANAMTVGVVWFRLIDRGCGARSVSDFLALLTWDRF